MPAIEAACWSADTFDFGVRYTCEFEGETLTLKPNETIVQNGRALPREQLDCVEYWKLPWEERRAA